MRCEFSEHEWCAIKPMLPNKCLASHYAINSRLSVNASKR